MQAEAATGGDKNLAIAERIDQFGQATVRAWCGKVEFGGAFHIKRLMRPFGIELADEGVEAFLLLQAVAAWWPGCFLFEGEVHSLVTAVLLRMAGLDAFDGDAEPEPPDRELREIEQGIGTGEGHAVVGAHGKRQAALAEQPFEGGNCRLFAGGIERFADRKSTR